MTQVPVVHPDHYQIPQELKDIFMRTVFNGLTEEEAIVAYRLARRRNLDVEARQIFFVPYVDKQGRRTVVSQTSIDGLRLIALKTGKYGGSVNPRLTIKDKNGVKLVIPHEEYDPGETDQIISGTIAVINTDFPQPQSATALFKSYCKTYNGNPTGLWATMPDVMILKCAESLALRRAFPQDLTGIYTSDEMEQARNEAAFNTHTSGAPTNRPSLKNYKPKSSARAPSLTQAHVDDARAETAQEAAPQPVTVEIHGEDGENESRKQTISDLVNYLPDGLRKMNPDIDPDVFEACRISILNFFHVNRIEEIPEDRIEDVRHYMRHDMITMLKGYGYL